MITDPGGLGDAAERAERVPSALVTVDWAGDGSDVEDVTAHVGDITIARQITGDLPDEAVLVEGSSVAELTVALPVGDAGDNEHHAAWWFSRYNSASPLYGKERLSRPVSVELGFETSPGSPLRVRRFTGLTTALPVSSTDRSATLRALDNRERLRTDVAVPAVAADYGTGSIIKPGLNAQWLVDYVFRRNGYGASNLYRNPPDLVIASATMHGSAYPDVGSILRAGRYDTSTGEHDVCTFTDGRFGYALDGPTMSGATPVVYNVAEYQFTDAKPLPANTWDYIGGDFFLSGVPAAMTGVTPQNLMNVYNAVDPDIITLEIRDVSGVRKLRLAYSRGSSGAAFLDVNFTATFHIQWAVQMGTTGRNLFIWQDGVQSGSNAITDAALPVDTGAMDRVRVTALGVVEGVNLIFGTPGSNTVLGFIAGWQARAELGPSKNELVAAIATEARDSWELLKEIAQAEQAWVAFDDTGLPFYRTQDWWAEPEQQTVSATITADRDLLELAYEDGVPQVRNQISAPVKTVLVTGLEDVYSLPLYVHPRTTRRFLIEFDNPVIDLDTSVQSISGGLPGPGVSRVQANSAKNGTGIDLTGYITVEVEFWTSTTAMLRVTNRASARGAYLTDGADGPGLFLAGSRIVADQNNTIAYGEDAPSIAEFGPRPLMLPDNPWRQDPVRTDSVIGALLARLSQPQATPVGLRIVANPLLQLGDRVRIQDPGGTELDDEFWLTRLDDEISPTAGFTQPIGVRRAWTVAVWDSSTWGDGSVWGP